MKNLLIILFFLITNTIYSQSCSVDVLSSNGYTVHMEFDIASLNVPATCTNPSYNYTVNIDYDISFIDGSGSLWTLQGYVGCDDDNAIFFGLPNSGGTGTSTSSTATRNLVQGDCSSATPSTLNCGNIQIEIQGSGIPYQTVSCNVALPIDLLFFDAYKKSNYIQIDWITENEKNNDFFTVEKSDNLKDWTIVEIVDASSNSSMPVYYGIQDYEELNKTVYYRLKQTDYNGKYEYFNIVSVHGNNEYFNFYPNPVNNSNNLTIESSTEIVKIDVYNSLGVLQECYYNKNNSSIDISNLSSGVYVVKAKFENLKIHTKKINIE